VGKTTTVVNLGACLALAGFRTLIIDIDPQGNVGIGARHIRIDQQCRAQRQHSKGCRQVDGQRGLAHATLRAKHGNRLLLPAASIENA